MYFFLLTAADISCIVMWSLSAHSACQSQAVPPLPLKGDILEAVCDRTASHPSSGETAARKCDHKPTAGARVVCQGAGIWRGSMSLNGNSYTVEITTGTNTNVLYSGKLWRIQ